MRIKRVLQGTVLTALAAAAWMGAGSTDASAAVDPVNGVTFNGTSLEITADSKDLEVMTSVAKASGSDSKIKISAWDVYEGNKAIVDLSKLNVTKDNYIAVKTDDMDKPFLVKIAATTKKTKVNLDKEKATITSVDLTSGTATDVQVRTAIGSYGKAAAVASFDFSNYQYQGASLYVRVPASVTAPTSAGQLQSAIKNDTTSYNVYSVGTLPGKEAKVNIAKQANGPAVPVDYVKGKVTIPSKTQYRVVVATASALATSGGAVSSQKDVKNVSELLNGASKAVVEVRKAATAGKKCASKWTRVVITAPNTFAEDSITTEFKADAATADAIAKVTTSGSLEIKYATKTVKRVETKTGFNISNGSGVAFQYYVGDDANTAVDKDVKTLKASTGKATLNKDASGKKVWIRVAGEKKTSRWAGEWTLIGTLPTIS